MPPTLPSAPHATELDEFVDRFEQAAAAGEVDVAAYFPAAGHPLFSEIGLELLRVDLEWSWRRRAAKSLAVYRDAFPDLWAMPEVAELLAFEERRLQASAPTALPHLAKDEPAGYPAPGNRVLGFLLLEELGRGAFGRVYLAEQEDLANRQVALKITRLATPEPQRLARLQHPAIVPIYSVHAWGAFQVICMPFRGRTTLADRVPSRSRAHDSGANLETRSVFHEPTTKLHAPGEHDRLLGAAGPQVRAGSDPAPASHPGEREIVRWMAELASGLAHAHARGVLHGDLKPANVLLAEDGQPLLVDFNLSQEVGVRTSDAGFAGGTLPYMSPEQIQRLWTPTTLGPASDLYSLGILFFELLTGERPFVSSKGTLREVTAAALAERRKGAPALSTIAPDCSPAVAAAVRQLLAERPENRYRSAAELEEDLRRHLDDLPLRHAPNPSLRERLGKWRRRHPRLASGASVALAALVLLMALGSMWAVREYRAQGDTALWQYRAFRDDAAQARVLLWTPALDDDTASEGRRLAEAALASLQFIPDSNWREAWPFARLAPVEQAQAEALSCELGLLLANDALRRAASAQGEAREVALGSARQYNRAAASSPASHPWRKALLIQRATLEELQGQVEQSAATRRLAQATPLAPSDDALVSAIAILLDGQGALAAKRFAEATTARPDDATAWYLRGLAEQMSGDAFAAEETLTAAVTLAPASYLAWFQRGALRLEAGRFDAAARDFDHALRLQPHSPPALINRALAAQGLGDPQRAYELLTRAIEAGSSETRVFLLRAAVARKLGRSAEADADRRQGLERAPRDERSWNARGLAQLPESPQQALADFDQALAINPYSSMSLRNKAHVLSERLGQNERALPVLDRLVELAPHDPAAWAGRGVTRARLAMRAEALEDARNALQRTHDPLLTYQVACIYSQTSRIEPSDVAEAVRLLAVAWQARAEFVRLAEQDPDLQPLVDQTEFQTALQAAQTLARLGRPNPSSAPGASRE